MRDQASNVRTGNDSLPAPLHNVLEWQSETQRECARFMPCWSPFSETYHANSLLFIPGGTCKIYIYIYIRHKATMFQEGCHEESWSRWVKICGKDSNLGKGSWRIDRPQKIRIRSVTIPETPISDVVDCIWKSYQQNLHGAMSFL